MNLNFKKTEPESRILVHGENGIRTFQLGKLISQIFWEAVHSRSASSRSSSPDTSK